MSLLKPKNFKLFMTVSYNAITKAKEVFLPRDPSLEHRMKRGALVGLLVFIYRSLMVPSIIVPVVVFCMKVFSLLSGYG